MRNKKLYLYILLGALILVSCQEDISAQQEDNDINKSKSCSADKDELNKYEYFNNIKWINRDGVWSLSVSPKRSLRLSVSKDDIKKSWQELKENCSNDYRWPDSNKEEVLYQQYKCHFNKAKVKKRRNLEPEKDSINFLCN